MGGRHPTESTELADRLRRIEGQVRGLQRMIERGDPPTDILTQVAAARAALAAVGLGIVEFCVREQGDSPNADELLVAVERLVHL